MAGFIKAASPTLMAVTIGAHIVSLGFAGLGVWLVRLGATGTTEMNLFGQKISTTSVGIAAIFIGAIAGILMTRKLLSTISSISKGPDA